MLYIIGLGLGVKKYFTIYSVKKIKNSKKVFIDTYTGLITKSTLDFIKKLNSNVEILKREDCEIYNYIKIFDALETYNNISFIVPGDPLVATTHINLILECEKRKIKYKIIPGVSIFSAAFSLSGMQIYRIGTVVTFPIDYKNVRSVYYKVSLSRINNKHSLVLFEYDIENNRYVTPYEFAKYMLESGKVDYPIIILERIGFKSQKIYARYLSELKRNEIGKPPYSVIVPAKELHPIEEEYLKILLNR